MRIPELSRQGMDSLTVASWAAVISIVTTLSQRDESAYETICGVLRKLADQLPDPGAKSLVLDLIGEVELWPPLRVVDGGKSETDPDAGHETD